MSSKTTKHFSDAKTSRSERKYVNLSKYHKIAVRRFNKASRKDAKQAAKQYIG